MPGPGEIPRRSEGDQALDQTQHVIAAKRTVYPVTLETALIGDKVSGDGYQQAVGEDSPPLDGGSPTRAQSESSVALPPGPPQRPEDSSKARVLIADNSNPTSALLWCPMKGRSHANLIEFGFTSCGFCHQSLKPPEAIRASQQENQNEEQRSNKSADQEHSDFPQTKYSIQFLDTAGGPFAKQTWHEILDLDSARQKLTHRTDPVVEVVSVVSTSVSYEWRKFMAPPERDRLIREGFLTNPNYAMEIDHRYVVVRSEHVIRALRNIVTYWPGIKISGDSITIREPYALIYHHLDRIKEYQRKFHGSKDGDNDSKAREKKRSGFRHCDEEKHRHLKMLTDAIESQNLDNVLKEMKRHQKRPAVATFKMLWLLFKPGVTVYKRIRNKLAACVVKSCNYADSTTGSSWLLSSWHLEYDGDDLGRCLADELIAPFDGEKRVTDLPVFPAEHYDLEDGGALRRKLETRGERYFHLISGPRQVDYRGKTLDTDRWYEGRAVLDAPSYYNLHCDAHSRISPPIPKLGIDRDHSDLERQRRVVVDTMQEDSDSEPDDAIDGNQGKGDEHKPTKKPNQGSPWEGYDWIYPDETDTLDLVDPITGEISKHRYLLCPTSVVGFVLKSRKWELLDVELCRDIKFNTAAIDSVVMPDERKMIIKSLVYRYTDVAATQGKTPSSWTADFIQNKGEGQIFLLHGGPGVGKTFTAECIAESTGRPLLSLTCGDIGTSEAVAEERLSKWFRLAETWGAVMLLDEADVFLEKRATSDLERNSLVSIFLRMMEYYRGILFLTTNRVGHFDDAFVSRVHIVIEYQNLSEVDRERIWTQFFNKLQIERGKHISISGRAKRYVLKDPEVTQIPWNGREIRNAFQTAVAFAEYRFAHTPEEQRDEKACLEQEDFEKVCEMTGAFKKYLTAISGYDEATRARLDQARNDSFRSDRLR